MYSLNAFRRRKERAVSGRNLEDGFWASGEYFGFLNVFKYEDVHVVLDQYTIVEPGRTRTIYNWLQYFSPASLRREFGAAGLTVQSQYADVAGTPFDGAGREFAVVGVGGGTARDRIPRGAEAR